MNTTADKVFFDTNVLLYMYETDSRKRLRAKSLFSESAREGRLVLSTQVVQEFYVAGSRKLGVPREIMRKSALHFLKLPIVINGPLEIARAFEIEELYAISFWDALILAAAEAGKADVLFTEDLNHGQKYGSVLAVNPFLD
ncbi:MAG TPA: PIN domain-containing protein [Bryobacteraceae bacterium]|nr:PIN domain-containing protein [Bryobacteraceae bacterium]